MEKYTITVEKFDFAHDMYKKIQRYNSNPDYVSDYTQDDVNRFHDIAGRINAIKVWDELKEINFFDR